MARAPTGERADATAISIMGREKGAIWSLASRTSNQSVRAETVSPRRRGAMTAIASSIMRRCSRMGIPIFQASAVRAPGPTPSIARPRVMWSS